MINNRYAGIHPDKLPKVWFKYYLVYKYSWSKSTYVVGSDSDETLDKLLKELLQHKDIVRLETFAHYPLELLK